MTNEAQVSKISSLTLGHEVGFAEAPLGVHLDLN